jgi:hypothetical protein
MQPSGVRVQPGTTAWFRDRIQLAPGFPTTVQSGINGFQVVMQWKDLGGTRSSSPPLELGVQKGQFDVLGGYGCPSGSRKFVLPIGAATTGVWHEFVFHIHFDTAGRGWVDAWMDGRKVVDHYMPACGTIYPAPYQAYTALRAGYYRDPAISTSGTVLHDDYLYAADGSSPRPDTIAEPKSGSFTQPIARPDRHADATAHRRRDAAVGQRLRNPVRRCHPKQPGLVPDAVPGDPARLRLDGQVQHRNVDGTGEDRDTVAEDDRRRIGTDRRRWAVPADRELRERPPGH